METKKKGGSGLAADKAMTNRYKSVMDFKVRVLDFISIYA
jgi:hypothetical protein